MERCDASANVSCRAEVKGWIRIPSTRNETTSYNYWHIVSPLACSFLFFFLFFFRFEGTNSCLYFPLILSASSLARTRRDMQASLCVNSTDGNGVRV